MFSYQTAHYLIAALLLAIAYYAHQKGNRKVVVAIAAAAGVLGFLAFRQKDQSKVKFSGAGCGYMYKGSGPSVAADYFMMDDGEDLPSTVM